MAISIKASIGLRRRRAWNEFLVWVDRHQEDRWIFRGVADAKKHFLVPKIGRKAQVYSEPKELTIFRNFRRRARQFATIDGLSDWDLLALAQHHGLPTRLLDWSINPLIAAYFAVASSPHDTDARVYAAVAPRMIKTEIDVDPFQPKFVRSFVRRQSPRASYPREAYSPFIQVRQAHGVRRMRLTWTISTSAWAIVSSSRPSFFSSP